MPASSRVKGTEAVPRNRVVSNDEKSTVPQNRETFGLLLRGAILPDEPAVSQHADRIRHVLLHSDVDVLSEAALDELDS